MKTTTFYTITIIVLFLMNILLLFYCNLLHKNVIIQSGNNNSSSSIEVDLLKNNIKLQFELEGAEVKDTFSLLNKKGECYTLKQIVQSEKIVMWFPMNHCDECLLKESRKFIDYYYDLSEKTIIIVSSDSNEIINYFQDYKNIFIASQERPYSDIIKKDNPIVFLMDISLKTKNIFIPEPLFPGLTLKYYNAIEKIISHDKKQLN